MESSAVIRILIHAIAVYAHAPHGHANAFHGHEDDIAHAAKHFSLNPPLPSSLGRPITGCFLPNEKHCVGGNEGNAAVLDPTPTQLTAPAFRRVPLKDVAPTGWLARQLLLQADGMSGWYQALHYPPVNDSLWVGGHLKYDLHYMVTYWLNGNVPLAILLENGGLAAQHNLTAITRGYVDFIMAAQGRTSTGRLGPDNCSDHYAQFSKFNAVRALLMAAEREPSGSSSRRSRIGVAVLSGIRELHECTLAGRTSGGIRWPSYLEAIDEFIDAFAPNAADFAWLMNTSLTWRASGADWQTYYADPHFPDCPFPHTAVPHPTHAGCEGCYYHGVNTAEALKIGAVQFRLWGRDADATLLLTHLAMLDASHGKPDGAFGMDEFLAGRNPQRGTELCDVVELLYSIHWSVRQVGERLLSTLDRAELLAFNALPGTTTPDLWQHQYDHQTNSIKAGPGVYCGGSNGPDATVYGLQPHYPCCTVNLPQGWPKLAAGAVLRDSYGRVVIMHLLPLRIELADLRLTLTIETEYPFGDTATIRLAPSQRDSAHHAAGQSVAASLVLRVPGWADAATISVDGGPERALANGTLHNWQASSASTAVVHLNPAARVSFGWGDHAVPAPTAVNFTAAGRNVTVPSTQPDDDWLFADGAGLSATLNQSHGGHAQDIRSGGPGQHSAATVSHPLNSDGHVLSSIAMSFQYTAGYTPGAGERASASRVRLALVDALNYSLVAVVYSSPPLGHYSYDRFRGYSPPIFVEVAGLSIAWPRSLRVALLFDNQQRNVMIPLQSLAISIVWSEQRQPMPFTPSDLRTPPVNAAAVARGPLLFGLPLQPTTTTLHMPASGGKCEKPTPKGGTCKSSDLSFELGPEQVWNYALLLPAGEEPSSALTFHRTADRAPKVPFDPSQPPVYITVAARVLPAWTAHGSVTDPPPASPVSDRLLNEDAAEAVSSRTLRLVPFGSTQIRIAAFPWAWQ